VLKFCDDEPTYIKPVDLFLKHQLTKLNSMRELEKYRYLTVEIKNEYDDLDNKIDETFEYYEKENCFKKALFINSIKTNCLLKYKNFMDLNVKKVHYFILFYFLFKINN
jgi:hypothetical protein